MSQLYYHTCPFCGYENIDHSLHRCSDDTKCTSCGKPYIKQLKIDRGIYDKNGKKINVKLNYPKCCGQTMRGISAWDDWLGWHCDKCGKTKK